MVLHIALYDRVRIIDKRSIQLYNEKNLMFSNERLYIMKTKSKFLMIKNFIIITFGATLAAAAIYFFMLPSHVAVGSASALGMVLSNFIPLPVSVITLALNVFLIIMGRV